MDRQLLVVEWLARHLHTHHTDDRHRGALPRRLVGEFDLLRVPGEGGADHFVGAGL